MNQNEIHTEAQCGKIAEIKTKREFWKQQKKNDLCTREPLIRPSSDFSGETMQNKREWDDILKVLKNSNQEYCSQKNCPFIMKER